MLEPKSCTVISSMHGVHLNGKLYKQRAHMQVSATSKWYGS